MWLSGWMNTMYFKDCSVVLENLAGTIFVWLFTVFHFLGVDSLRCCILMKMKRESEKVG